MRNGFLLCSSVMLLSGMTAIADPPIAVTLGRPVPLYEAVHLGGPVQLQGPGAASPIQQTSAFSDGTAPAPAIYRAQAGPDPLFPPPPGPPAGPPGIPGPPCPGVVVPPAPPAASVPRFWIDGEYLMWWVRNGPEPLGGSANYGVFSGFKIDGGGWIDPSEKIGLEGSFFFLGRNGTSLAGAEGAPLLPPVITGGEHAYTSSQLWGAEFNGLFDLYRDCHFQVDLLGGFRYIGLQENLSAYGSGLMPVPGILPIFVPVTASARVTAQNNFYGGQFGARGAVHYEHWFADITAKVALGAMCEGLTAQSVTNSPIGVVDSFQRRRTIGTFDVVPEVNLRVGYSFTPNIRAFVAYDYLYLSDVARPGNQNFAGLFGTAPSVKTTDFWAQGVSIGVEFTF